MSPKYQIDQKFMTRGKFSKLCTVIDILTTYNSKGELVKIRYVAEHSFMGQSIVDHDVCEASISMGLIRGVAA